MVMHNLMAQNSVLAVQGRVIKALMLRDIRTRFFGNGLGYIVAILWPLTHIAVLLSVYYFTGRVAPLGESVVQFFAVAVLPVIGFQYMARFVMLSVNVNRPLLNFPIVKFVDIILARGILEAACTCCVAALLTAILFGLDVPIVPASSVQAATALVATLLLGLGVGALNGLIVLKLPGWMLVYMLISIILYITSGVIFMPNSLPDELREIAAWNPVLHSVEWMREAFYVDYTSLALDRAYLWQAGALCLFTALACERTFRKFFQR